MHFWRNSASAAMELGVPLPGGSLAPADAKTDLNQFCQRYCKRPVTKQDIVYVVNRFGPQYQSIVKLNCFSGQEYAGHLSISAKEAEKSAAHQALLAYASTIEALAEKGDQPKNRRKIQQQLTPQQLAEKKAKQAEEGENPAITPKTKLNSLCMKIAKRYLQKGETVYTCHKVAGGYQATVKLVALPGDWAGRCWAGEVCSTKQKAEQSAAGIALEQILADPELSAEAERPKGKGRGKGKGKGEKGEGKGDYWSYGGWVWQASAGPDDGRQRVGEGMLTGEILEWKETYGWLKADTEIDHPAAGFREGKIYVNKKDLGGEGAEVAAGSKVKFFLYEDPAGLGAEEVVAA